MPIYAYEREDGTTFDIIQKVSDDVLTECPTTGQKVKRLISPPALHFKGSGFYITDYTDSGKKSDSKSESSSTSTESSKSTESAKTSESPKPKESTPKPKE